METLVGAGNAGRSRLAVHVAGNQGPKDRHRKALGKGGRDAADQRKGGGKGKGTNIVCA